MGLGLKATGLSKLGRKNALDLRLTRIVLTFPNLPKVFSGMRILHLSDLHLDNLELLAERIVQTVRGLSIDLIVLTGDYQEDYKHLNPQVVTKLKSILGAVQSRYGTLATLGNHDNHEIVEAMERIGIRVLINETREFSQEGEKISVTGLDDVHHFYSETASQTLQKSGSEFKLLAVHSPEIFQLASETNYSLYLCGHTHGGQICWPNGKPVFSHLHCGKQFASGLWAYGKMLGFTNRGAGVTTLPCRFFCPPEIALITLQRRQDPEERRDVS